MRNEVVISGRIYTDYVIRKVKPTTHTCLVRTKEFSDEVYGIALPFNLKEYSIKKEDNYTLFKVYSNYFFRKTPLRGKGTLYCGVSIKLMNAEMLIFPVKGNKLTINAIVKDYETIPVQSNGRGYIEHEWDIVNMIPTKDILNEKKLGDGSTQFISKKLYRNFTVQGDNYKYFTNHSLEDVECIVFEAEDIYY